MTFLGFQFRVSFSTDSFWNSWHSRKYLHRETRLKYQLSKLSKYLLAACYVPEHISVCTGENDITGNDVKRTAELMLQISKDASNSVLEGLSSDFTTVVQTTIDCKKHLCHFRACQKLYDTKFWNKLTSLQTKLLVMLWDIKVRLQ